MAVFPTGGGDAAIGKAVGGKELGVWRVGWSDAAGATTDRVGRGLVAKQACCGMLGARVPVCVCVCETEMFGVVFAQRLCMDQCLNDRAGFVWP